MVADLDRSIDLGRASGAQHSFPGRRKHHPGCGHRTGLATASGYERARRYEQQFCLRHPRRPSGRSGGCMDDGSCPHLAKDLRPVTRDRYARFQRVSPFLFPRRSEAFWIAARAIAFRRRSTGKSPRPADFVRRSRFILQRTGRVSLESGASSEKLYRCKNCRPPSLKFTTCRRPYFLIPAQFRQRASEYSRPGKGKDRAEPPVQVGSSKVSLWCTVSYSA